MIKVSVVGAGGRMGREVCRAVLAEQDLELVAAIDPEFSGKPLADLTGETQLNLAVKPDLPAMTDAGTQVMVDFTQPASAFGNTVFALEHGIHAVVGTTGMSAGELEELERLAAKARANLLIAPNFAMGAVLMMVFARQAAQYFPDCEIIELHHDRKLDAPSGTSLRTAAMIAETREGPGPGKGAQPPSRGLEAHGIRVHSVRLPGLIAHQEVIFGSAGQSLTIRHDSYDRNSFMPGVIYAVRNIGAHAGMTVGLEKWLSL
jgi:4-hydroxy-tetrahydrodipicolinate reductase